VRNKTSSILDLQAIHCRENGERMVLLNKFDVPCRTSTSIQDILVRESIALKLQQVQKKLQQYNENMHLLVVDGYRPLANQEKWFCQKLLKQYQEQPFLNFDALIEQTHQFVSLPSVSGHPTGGAVDLTIACAGHELDMGCKIADFSNPLLLPTYSSCLGITSEQTQRRLMLLNLMVSEGFAPFYGEWWHFSYGDREWATFYGHKETLFSIITKTT
jgi:zinc D-Ala-D-Ala dipeptidase